MSGSAVPDPATAGNAVEFIAMLREVRESSGLTYRQIQRRAEGLALTLPPSTLATMLGRETLPREELVSTLVRCCGLEPEPWLMAYRRLRQEQRRPAVVHAVAMPEVVPRRFKHPRTAVAVAVIGILSLLGLSSESFNPDRMNPYTMVAGRVLLVAAESGLCVSEFGTSQDGFLYLRKCDDHIVPDRWLEDLGDGRYLIRTYHSVHGPGCMGYEKYWKQTRPGDARCEDLIGEELILTKIAGPFAGFQLKFADLGWCLAVAKGDSGVGSDIEFAACDSRSARQVFVFAPA